MSCITLHHNSRKRNRSRKSVKKLGGAAFIYCDSLKSVVLHEGMEEIGYSAFTSCKSLISISLPTTLIKIGNAAFSGCNTLPEIILPENVAELGTSVFEWCKLEQLTVLATTPPIVTETTFKSLNMDIPVYVPQGSLETYQSAEFWNQFTNIIEIPNTTTGLETHNTLANQIFVFKDEIKLNLPAEALKAGVHIYDMAGQCVRTTYESNFTLPQPGTYILQVGNKSVKIIIK